MSLQRTAQFLIRKTSRYCPFTATPGIIFPVLLLIFSAGCSKEKMDELVASAKEKTTQISDATATMKEQVSGVTAGVSEKAERAMDQIETVLPGSGEMNLELEKPVTLSRADLQIVRVDEKRSVVLQVFSYPIDKPITDYPSVMLRALAERTSADFSDASPWFGKPLECSVFIQETADGPIWATESGKSVSITLTANPDDAAMVSGTLGTGMLLGSDGTSRSLEGGSVTAKMLPIVGGSL